MKPMLRLQARGIGAAIVAAAMSLPSATAGAREWVALPAAPTTNDQDGASISLSPYCSNFLGKTVNVPALILVGRLDDWTPAADCERFVAESTNQDPFELIVYPHSLHGLDDAGWRQSPKLETLRDYARRLYESDSTGERAAALLNRDYAKLRTCISG